MSERVRRGLETIAETAGGRGCGIFPGAWTRSSEVYRPDAGKVTF